VDVVNQVRVIHIDIYVHFIHIFFNSYFLYLINAILCELGYKAGNTSLQLASRKGNYEVCKLLLKNGAERRDW